MDVPVRLESEDQDVVVCPRDYLIGDLNGVVCLPRGLAGRAVGLLEGLVRADEGVRRDLERGRGFVESCAVHRV